MDSLILNQSLKIYGQSHVAICQLPAKTSEALDLLKKGWLSVVVLDQNERPQGLFNARSLLSWQCELDGCKFASPAIALEDIDLEPLPAILIEMRIADFLQRILQYQHSAETWALVDQGGKFIAILDVSSLLRSLMKVEQIGKSTMIEVLLPFIYQLPLPMMLAIAMARLWV